jgi:hypothetical protein
MNHLELPGLRGQNTLGFLAALGVLVLANEAGLNPKLSWTDDINQSAIIVSGANFEELGTLLLHQLEVVATGVLLTGEIGRKQTDVKLFPNNARDSDLRKWTDELRVSGTRLERRLLGALVAEGAVDGKGAAKPSHLHFAAGQQQFLDIARDVLAAVKADPTRLAEALLGPWRSDADVKNFSWASGTERIFAVRGFKPSSEKRLGIPGADALAFVGLSMLPVMEASGSLRTTGCDRGWKSSAFSWSLWNEPLSTRVVQSILVMPHSKGADAKQRGITDVLRSPIRRTDQGGYGSFGAPQMNL